VTFTYLTSLAAGPGRSARRWNRAYGSTRLGSCLVMGRWWSVPTQCMSQCNRGDRYESGFPSPFRSGKLWCRPFSLVLLFCPFCRGLHKFRIARSQYGEYRCERETDNHCRLKRCKVDIVSNSANN